MIQNRIPNAIQNRIPNAIPGRIANMIQNKFQAAVFGWMIGDALGTTTEFMTNMQAEKIMEENNYYQSGLVGQGVFKLQPGQFTDDTELGLSAMKSIMECDSYDADSVARMYHYWYNSKPFDIGTTTKNSVCQPSYSKMIQAARTLNHKSLSNGFLMRLPGIVALHSMKSKSTLIMAIMEDVKLTHPHPEASHIACIYGMMLYLAINDASASQIYSYGKNHAKYSPLIGKLYTIVESGADQFTYDGQTYCWKDMSTKNIGFVGYALWLLLIELKTSASYEDSMLKIASMGGDADTNACICGAILGALYPKTIPDAWVKSVINCCADTRYKDYPLANPNVWLQWLYQ